MRRHSLLRRRAAGMTLVETVVASGITLVLLGVAIPAFSAAGDAGDQGSARVLVDADTREALLAIAREMQNTSTTATDDSGNPYLTIVDGGDPDPMVQNVNGETDMGGFEGSLGDDVNTDNSNADPNHGNVMAGTAPTMGAGDSHESGAMGSGARGNTTWGRLRSDSGIGTVAFGTNSLRPRHAVIAKNSILTFQKVSGYSIGADGGAVITWTTPVSYQVVNRKLTRVQDGLTTVICPVCVAFQAQVTDVGTVVVTIVSQTKTHGKGGLVAEANQIEISPKN